MAYNIGDPVIYRKTKNSSRPGPRARQVYPLERGETYHYVVDKYWKVVDVNDDEYTVDVVTRTGKLHRLAMNDPNLYKPPFLKYLMLRKRFPDVSAIER